MLHPAPTNSKQQAWYAIRDVVLRLLESLAQHENVRLALVKFADDVKVQFNLQERDKLLQYLRGSVQPFDFRCARSVRGVKIVALLL